MQKRQMNVMRKKEMMKRKKTKKKTWARKIQNMKRILAKQ